MKRKDLILKIVGIMVILLSLGFWVGERTDLATEKMTNSKAGCAEKTIESQMADVAMWESITPSLFVSAN